MKQNLIQERTFKFALMIVKLYKELQLKKEYVIAKQILKSGTSIAANQEEAQAAYSKQEFISKLSISCKESRETRFWLRLIKESKLVEIDVDKELEEVNEILNILYRNYQNITRKYKKKTISLNCTLLFLNYSI